MRAEKTLNAFLSGAADAAIRFGDLCRLLEGSRHLFRKSRVEGEINLQRAGPKRQAVPSRTGSGGHPEGEAWFQAMTKYEVIIYWSEEDVAFVAEVPELSGCAAHGGT